jgi:hypothetical protein
MQDSQAAAAVTQQAPLAIWWSRRYVFSSVLTVKPMTRRFGSGGFISSQIVQSQQVTNACSRETVARHTLAATIAEPAPLLTSSTWAEYGRT